MKEYEQHEIGKCYPPLTDTEKSLLRAQLLTPGPKSKVVLFEDKVLDGWHQYTISKSIGIECEFEEVIPSDPISFVIQRNEGRRQLSTTARAKIVDNLAKLRRGNPNAPVGGFALDQLAQKMSVGATTVSKLRIVNNNQTADPAIAAAVNDEHITIDAGYEAQRLPKDQQTVALEQAKAKRAGGKCSTRIRSKAKTPEPRRPGTLKFPTAEQTGLPVNGTMSERDAHHRKYGRTPLYPKAIADIINHSHVVSGYVAAITMAASDAHPSLEQFFGSVDAMLAWLPDKQKGGDWAHDWATNFASKARKELSRLEERLPILLERLSNLQKMIEERSTYGANNNKSK